MSLDEINFSEKLFLFLQNTCNSCIVFTAFLQHWLLLAILVGDLSLYDLFFKHLRPFEYPFRVSDSSLKSLFQNK